MDLNDRANIDLFRLLNDYKQLSDWKNKSDLRVHASLYRSDDDFIANNFCMLDALIKKPDRSYSDKNFSILFAHFPPHLTELEGLGLPLYAKKMYPNSKIDLTYDKGYFKRIFRLGLDNISTIDEVEKSYDFIIARSSVLTTMSSRGGRDAQCIRNSSKKINIKTMSLKSNFLHADICFDEEDMCPPPDPVYLSRSNAFLKNNKKQNLIAVSGTLWHVKNQLKMLQDLDPNLLQDYRIVILGPMRESHYVKEIIDTCEAKSFNYYIIGNVSRELANEIKTMSKISLIPMDMRVFGQPKGYPRTLGESIGSKCLTLCNKPVTIPDFYSMTARVYDESINNDINIQLEKCIEDVSKEGFLENHNWGQKTFEDVCEATLRRCL